MRVYDLKDAEGRVFAFEIENVVIGRNGVCAVVERIPGATLTRRPLRFLSWFRESSFCEFELDGVRFLADEGPWGDDKRYWIGAEPPRWVPQLEVVRQAFVEHRLMIDIMSLLRRIAIILTVGMALILVAAYLVRQV